MKDDIPSAKKLNSSVPQSLENIVMRATAKNPKNRYDDVKEMYNDLKVCLNEENLNQPPYVYKYPEHEVDEKDSNLKEVKNDSDEKNKKEKNNEDKPVAKKIDNVEEKKGSFSTVIIVILLLVFISGVTAIGFVLYPMLKGSDNEKIPDVSGLSVSEAEKVLTGKGFIVLDETKKENNDKIEEGLVIGTDPAIGRSRAKGTKITLIESLGKNDTYVIENYVGKNYIEVQTTLEKVYKMKVDIQKKDVDITDDMDLQLILEQDLAVGTEITISEDNPATITLWIPNAYEQYPDFVKEGWTVQEVQEFVEKYELSLDIKYVESDEYPAGTIIYQSRSGKIVNGAYLLIKVTKEVEKKEEPKEEKKDEQKEENNSKEESNEKTTTDGNKKEDSNKDS